MAPGGRRHAVRFGGERGGASEVADPRGRDPQGVEIEWQLREGARLAHESDKSRRNRQIALLIPHGGRGSRGRYTPPKEFLVRHIGKGFCCSLQGWRRGGKSLGTQHSQAIEKHVMRARRPIRLRKGSDGATDLS